MNGEFGKILHRLGCFVERFEADELISHPLKQFSRRFLSAGIWGAGLLHFVAAGGVYLLSWIDFEPVSEIEILPYPTHLIDIIDPNKLVAVTNGGGRPGQLELPDDTGEDVMSKSVAATLELSLPEPVDVMLISEEHEIASQKEPKDDMAIVDDTASETNDGVGMRSLGVKGHVLGGSGGGGGGMGDGTLGTWTYDKPPVPRRINMNISRKEIPNELRHVKNNLVSFQLLINELGEVVDAKMIESTGYAEIDELLLKKIYASMFHPALLRQHPVKAWTDTVSYGYKVGR